MQWSACDVHVLQKLKWLELSWVCFVNFVEWGQDRVTGDIPFWHDMLKLMKMNVVDVCKMQNGMSSDLIFKIPKPCKTLNMPCRSTARVTVIDLVLLWPFHGNVNPQKLSYSYPYKRIWQHGLDQNYFLYMSPITTTSPTQLQWLLLKLELQIISNQHKSRI